MHSSVVFIKELPDIPDTGLGTILRLTEEERELLNITCSALKVSEYTDDVDSYRLRTHNHEDKMIHYLFEFFTILFGLMHSTGLLPRQIKDALNAGEVKNIRQLVALSTDFLQRIFEIARRYKRFNPTSIREEYGKMTMMLQDITRLHLFPIFPQGSVSGFGDLKKEVSTSVECIYVALSRAGVSKKLFCDNIALLAIATSPSHSVADKGDAMHRLLELVPSYKENGSAEQACLDTVERCIRSLDDHRLFVEASRRPIALLLHWLDVYFPQNLPVNGRGKSLEIRANVGGSCLSHNHQVQHLFVKESLILWDIILRDNFIFWECAESDMLMNEGSYRFCDTGQGYHRLCGAPRTNHQMHRAIHEAETIMVEKFDTKWIGLQVVHLGDHDVPNALVFIDKYTGIPKILVPIVHTLEEIFKIYQGGVVQSSPSASGSAQGSSTAVSSPVFVRYPGIYELFVQKFGPDPDVLCREILCDFFRHGFDGSGDDGGSCIDGRLTSAWNWCENLSRKPYYLAFVLTGFTGFD